MMPPRKRISAPEGRVYRSTVPLKQTKFQEPRKRINSYGKSSSKRITRPDNTLTQMDYVIMNQLLDEEEKEEGMDLYGAEAELAKPQKQRRKAVIVDPEDEDTYEEEAEKRKKRRRKTAEDIEEVKVVKGKNKRRKTIGDVSSSSSNFHTQTLTQIQSWSSTYKSMSPEVQQPEDDHIFSGPISSQVPPPATHRRTRSKVSTADEPQQDGSSPAQNTSHPMDPPQTPHRRMASEIPSSQSPATPFSYHSRSSTAKRSPLRLVSSNTPIPFSITSRSTPQKKIAKLVIQDTFSTAEESQLSRIPSSPAKRSSPAKSVRFADARGEDGSEAEDEEEEAPLTEENEWEEIEAYPSTAAIKCEPESTQFPTSQMLPSQPILQAEILDSEAESDMDDDADFEVEQEDEVSPLSEEDPEVDGTLPEEGLYNNPNAGNMSADGNEDEEEQEHETYYGEIGLETQMQAENLLISQVSTERVEESQDLGGEESQATKSGQSQRISLPQANLMAPRTLSSDIFISLHPPHVRNIVTRRKDHEFRTWAIPDSVVRIWIYETAPASKVKYMAAISAAKRPGEILDERGIGNAEFNRKPAESSEYAYEILDLYKLANPQSLAMLKEKEWMRGPPQKMAWVKPAVLDDLMGNLKPPLFTKVPYQVPLVSWPTDTQEADAQLHSTIQQFTQAATGEHNASTSIAQDEEYSDEESEGIPTSPNIKDEQFTYQEYTTSTQHENPEDVEDQIEDEIEDETEDEELSYRHLPALTQHANPHMIRPSQAETVDSSQLATARCNELPDIILESPARQVPSSIPRLPPSTARMSNQSDSIMPLSSQLMTKSQMLPESLLYDSVPAPPDFVQDSDEEN